LRSGYSRTGAGKIDSGTWQTFSLKSEPVLGPEPRSGRVAGFQGIAHFRALLKISTPHSRNARQGTFTETDFLKISTD
jgi:hypothetical protein